MANNISESLNNILQIIETRCTDAGGDIHIDPNHLYVFSAETDYLLERMGLSPFQAILFAVIIQINASVHCTFNSVAKRLGISYLQLLSFSKDLYALRDRWLIRIKGNNEIRVPAEVIDSLMKDTSYEKPSIDGLSAKSMFRRISAHMKSAYDEQMSASQLLEETELLLSANPETCYAKACAHYLTANNIGPSERLLIHVASYLYLMRGVRVCDMSDIEAFIQDETWRMALTDLFDIEALSIQEKGIIEPAKANGLMTRGSFSIKEEIAKEMFADVSFNKSNLKTIDLNDLSGKPAKHLFYNSREKEQVVRLESLLSPNSLNKVFETMKAKGLSTGFTCLFYGDPGTGKTETVYQMARKTGRKILEADVAKLRNCYVGETEKNMRALFADYRTACGENELTPILLFNEADAILGKRMEGAAKAVDRMENSVQNILLQELEDFNGIMIATTNLLDNLDPAFERRFLFKIRFNKPELEPRSQIWKSQFPFLTDEEATSLAKEFFFSGGQIENIVRKYTIDNILSEADSSIDQLRQYCREESVRQSPKNRIGF